MVEEELFFLGDALAYQSNKAAQKTGAVAQLLTKKNGSHSGTKKVCENGSCGFLEGFLLCPISFFMKEEKKIK